MNVRTRKVVAAVLALGALTLAGCSSSGSDKVSQGADEKVEVTIDPALQEKLNPEPGQAIIPGSIESVTQENLSGACEAAVDPIRKVMVEFKSGLLVAPDKLNDVSQLRAKAEEACGAQEYTDWYTKEFAGWLNGKTK